MNRYFFVFAFFLLGDGVRANAATTEQATLPVPRIVSLQVEPASLTFHNGRDARHVLVIGKTADGQKIDLTGEMKLSAAAPLVDFDQSNSIWPRANGETKITVSAAGLTASLSAKVVDEQLPPVGFVRDVEPLLSKIGCNAGTCHGSAKGKNGFKLSLRGYDPEFDYQALINDLSGRRFNRVQPQDSLDVAQANRRGSS